MSWRKGEHPQRRRWGKVRLVVFDRDGWKCRTCGRGGRLECDHIQRLEDGGALYDLGNLQTLCRGCHFDKSQFERRGRGPSPEVEAWKRYLRTA